MFLSFEAVQVQVHNKELLSPVQETEVKLNPCTLEPTPLDLHICSNSIKAGPSSVHQANLNSVPLSSCKYLSDSLDSEESEMNGAKGPSFKAKAPKNSKYFTIVSCFPLLPACCILLVIPSLTLFHLPLAYQNQIQKQKYQSSLYEHRFCDSFASVSF